MKFGVIITAGGASTRFGANNKLLEIVQNKTVIEHTLQKFLDFDEIIITAKKEIIRIRKIV